MRLLRLTVWIHVYGVGAAITGAQTPGHAAIHIGLKTQAAIQIAIHVPAAIGPALAWPINKATTNAINNVFILIFDLMLVFCS